MPAGRMGRITESGNFILNLGYGDPFVIYFYNFLNISFMKKIL